MAAEKAAEEATVELKAEHAEDAAVEEADKVIKGTTSSDSSSSSGSSSSDEEKKEKKD